MDVNIRCLLYKIVEFASCIRRRFMIYINWTEYEAGSCSLFLRTPALTQ
jgi:hypothetical protein